MRRDSTEEGAAASVCAVAVTLQRNYIQREGSQQLLDKQLFSPARLQTPSLITRKQPAGKLEMLQMS